MRIVAIIPARMAASRFPGKPLTTILGLPMIEHVRRRVALCPLIDDAVVATCDDEIKNVVEETGGTVVMTSDRHTRCTDRVAEAAASIDAEVVVNIQGDEPLVVPRMLEEVLSPILDDSSLPATNLVMRIVDREEFLDPNVPKVVTNLVGDLLYISREPIPSQKMTEDSDYLKLKQLGIIAFRSDFLQVFAGLEPSPLEQIEAVDMMRAVEHGYRVRMVETTGQMIGVDVPRDVERIEKIMASDPLVEQYINV